MKTSSTIARILMKMMKTPQLWSASSLIAGLLVSAVSAAHAKVVVTDTPALQRQTTTEAPRKESPQQGYQYAPDTVQLNPQAIGLGLGAGLGLPGATPTTQELQRKRSAATSKRVSVQIQLGLARLHGIDMPPDIKQAGKDFMLAFAKGDAQAPAAVALCHLMGCYGTPDRRALAPWIERVRTKDPSKARLLEWASFEQFAPQDRLKATRSANLLQAAVRQLDPVALNEQGLQQVAAGQRQAAVSSFSQAAERGSAAAVRNLQLLTQMHNIQQSPQSAQAPQTSSTAANASATPAPVPGQAAYELAQKYHAGQGVPINYIQAVQYYRIAANEGHLQAKRMLDLIFSSRSPQGTLDDIWMRQLAVNATPSLAASNSAERSPQASASLARTNPLAMQTPAVWLQKDISLLADWLP